MRRLTAAVLTLGLLVTLVASAEARKRKGPTTAPGRYTDWDDEIDKLEIVETFKLADYQRVAIEPFDTSETPLPDADDNTYAPVKQVLAAPVPPFASGLQEEVEGVKVVLADKGADAGAGTLLIRGKVLQMDPGSQAARYWAGFGAGAARTEIVAELVDGASGKVLLRFTQERRSGVGAFGGDYVELLERNLYAIGEDAALILNAFR